MGISNVSSIPLRATTTVAFRPPSSQPSPRDDGDRDVEASSRASREASNSKPAERREETGRQVVKFSGPPKAESSALAQAELASSLKANQDAKIVADAKQSAIAMQAAHNAYGSTKALFG